MRRSSLARRILGLALTLALAVGFALPVTASASTAGDWVSGSRSAALTANPILGVLSVHWWQYVLGQPQTTSPLNDPTGAGCRTGQSGPVFFLVGTAGTGSATRDECVVPFGKALFFPIANAFDVHVPGQDDQDTPELIWNDLQNTFGFEVTSVFASVDGVKLPGLAPKNPLYRGCAGQDRGCAPRSFTLTFPADNPFGLPAGDYRPAVADGSYALIAPLKRGVHTIIFRGSGNAGGPFSQDIT